MEISENYYFVSVRNIQTCREFYEFTGTKLRTVVGEGARVTVCIGIWGGNVGRLRGGGEERVGAEWVAGQVTRSPAFLRPLTLSSKVL